MAIPARITILRWVRSFENIEKFENKTGRWKTPFPSRLCKQSVRTSCSTKQGPWREQLQIWEFRTLPYITSWKFYFTCFCTILQEYISYYSKLMLNEVRFLNCAWKTGLPIRISYFRQSFLVNVSFPSKDLRILVFPVRKIQERINNMNYTEDSNSLVCFGSQACGRSIFLLWQNR